MRYAILLALAIACHADSFSDVTVYQNGAWVQPAGDLRLSLAPTARILSRPTGYLLFAFDLDKTAALFTSSFTIDWTWPTGFTGPWTTTLMSWLDATGCVGDPCEAMMLIAIPKFTGTKHGSIHFTFGDSSSANYQFTITQPIPEPATLLLFGTGILWAVALRRLK